MTDIDKKRADITAGMLPSIRTCAQDPTGYTPEDCASDIMAVLNFKGVVIKADTAPTEDLRRLMPAGYVAVEPLIKEK